MQPKTQVSLVTLNPEQARAILEASIFERQRRLSHARVAYLKEEMEADRFVPGTQVYLARLPDGRRLLLNGQHTLNAISNGQKTVLVSIIIHEVQSIDEAGRLYAVFDIHRVRTWADSLLAVSGDQVDEFIKRCLPAIGIIENGMDTHLKTAESRLARIDAVEKYRDAIARLRFSCMTDIPADIRKYMMRAGCMAVAICTYTDQPSLAEEFWPKLTKDEGLIKGAPEKALLNWWRGTGSPDLSGRYARSLNRNAAAVGWNAYFRGDELVVVQPRKMTRFHLLGTRFHYGLADEVIDGEGRIPERRQRRSYEQGALPEPGGQ